MVLSGHCDTAVQIPFGTRIRQYKAAIQARHTSPTDVWCRMDLLKLSAIK